MIPMTKGKLLKIYSILSSIAERSLVTKFVIVPIYEDLKAKDVKVDILLNINIDRIAFIFGPKKKAPLRPRCSNI